MKNITISLINSDHSVKAITELHTDDGEKDWLGSLLYKVKDELLESDETYLEIEGLEKDPITLTVSQHE